MKEKYLYITGIVVLLVIIIIGFEYFTAKKEPAKNQANTSSKSNTMTFFVTSTNPGNGANLGGLSGADAHCQALATEAGAGNRTWRAYLSTTRTENSEAINARDRIGSGPWKNFQGTIIANNLDELHSNNNINKQTALTEKGQMVNGRGDNPNRHDILTGSAMDGRTIQGNTDSTCGNWTKSGEGSAMVGHHDRVGLNDSAEAKSWNSSHLSRGCSSENLASSGGGGLLYCFATN